MIDARATLHTSVRVPYAWAAFGTGLRVGALLILIFWVIYDCLLDARDLDDQMETAWVNRVVPLYRATAYWIVFYWLFGSMLFVCHKFRVNYALLFDFPSDYRLDYRKVLTHATGLSIVWCVNFLIHFKVILGQLPDNVVPEGAFPVALAIYLAYRSFLPWSSAKFWLSRLWLVVSAPFSPVTFVTVYIGDVMTSFTKPFNDWAFMCCFFFTGYWVQYKLLDENANSCVGSYALSTIVSPLMSALPLWFRFLQCLRRYYDTRERWPHLGNAGKYALSMTVALIGLTLPSSNAGVVNGTQVAWIVLLVLSTLYTFSWDVWMDWGLAKGCCIRTRKKCECCLGPVAPSGTVELAADREEDGADASAPDPANVKGLVIGGDVLPIRSHSPRNSNTTALTGGGGGGGGGGAPTIAVLPVGAGGDAKEPLLDHDSEMSRDRTHTIGGTPTMSGAADEPHSECCWPCANDRECNACAHDCYLVCGRNLYMFRVCLPLLYRCSSAVLLFCSRVYSYVLCDVMSCDVV